jgi:Uma2 family endonuclease
MSSAQSRDVPRFTSQQYLSLERSAEIRSEFDDGVIEAMSGASRKHNLITMNLAGELREQLKGRPCEVYAGDMRVAVESGKRFLYPDLVVVCGEPEFLDSEFDTLLNPVMIVEVLSPSTELRDRGRKFEWYRRLPSFREYVLVDQERVFVERFTRRNDDWVLSPLDRVDDTLRLESIQCEVPLEEVYARVTTHPGA